MCTLRSLHSQELQALNKLAKFMFKRMNVLRVTFLLAQILFIVSFSGGLPFSGLFSFSFLPRLQFTFVLPDRSEHFSDFSLI